MQTPVALASALEKGTGIRCDFEQLRALVSKLPPETQSNKLYAAFASVGRVETGELRPLWRQKLCGRVYAAKPSVIGMPKVLLSALVSLDGLPLWEVDYTSFELRIACSVTGQEIGEADVYGELAE
jgi:hypothetical protein